MKNFRIVAILLVSLFLMISCSAGSVTEPNDENTEAPRPSTEKMFYYGRSTLKGDMLLAYDFILDKLWDWEDAKIEVTDVQKKYLLMVRVLK